MATCKGWMKKGSLGKLWNDVHLEDEKMVRSRNSWMLEVRTGMREREIDDLEWVDKVGG